MLRKSIRTATVAIVALGMSAVSFANSYGSSAGTIFDTAGAGFLVGVQGGYADTHWDNIGSYGVDTKDTGFAARGFLGYDFNRYFGLETGYTHLPKTNLEFQGHDISDIKSYAIDLLAKLSLPVSNVFSVYAKAGGSYLHSKNEISGFSGSHIGPAFGVGAAYEVVPNLAIDLSWMRFSGNSKAGAFNQDGNFVSSDSYQPNPDVVLLGVSYKFPISVS